MRVSCKKKCLQQQLKLNPLPFEHIIHWFTTIFHLVQPDVVTDPARQLPRYLHAIHILQGFAVAVDLSGYHLIHSVDMPFVLQLASTFVLERWQWICRPREQ
jgi:hypothetical protein